MVPRFRYSMEMSACAILALAVGATGCASNRVRADLMRERDELQLSQAELERKLNACRERTQSLESQVARLQNFPDDRPVTLFEPVRVEVASLSRGSDMDGQPGDDGVTVYVRLYDADGDAMKAPGRLTVQVLDLAKPGQPASLGVCVLESAEALRSAWFGRFGTSHFKVVCPFDSPLPDLAANDVQVRVEFVPYLTGASLSTVAMLPITRPPT